MHDAPTTTDSATGQPTATHRREDLRCAVDWHRHVSGQFITGPVDNPLISPCTLADLSVGGCAVQIESLLPCEPRIAIVRFETADGLQMESAGRVCWTRQASIGYRTYGLRFRRPLPPQMLEQWIEQGVINRRDKQRHEVRLPVRLRRSDGGGSSLDAEICDYSATGMQLTANLPLAVGERVMVTLPDGHGVMASVVWNAVRGGECLVGCTLINRISSTNLSQFFHTYEPPSTKSTGGVLGRLRRCLTD